MSHSLPPKPERSSLAPNLPESLASALDRVRKAPTDLEAWEDLNEACREHDRPDEAGALYTEVLDQELQGDALEDVGRAAADFCEEWYEDTAPVLEMLSRVLELDAGQQWAFDRLTVLLTANAEWDKLLGAYDVALKSSKDTNQKQSLYEEAAKVARDFAGEHERASDYLKQLLLLRLNDEQLASSTERRFDEQGRHEDLIEIWTARLSVLGREAGLKTRLQIASRYLEQLSDATSALLAVEEFLEAEGSANEACAVLEQIADRDGADVEARRAALAKLDELYGAAGQTIEVISVTERALLLAPSDEERVKFHRQALGLYQQTGQLDEALGHCSAILRLDASLDDVREAARAIAAQIGRMDLFAEALISAASATASAERRIELLIEAAQVQKNQLASPDAAIELYFRVEKDEAADEAALLLACAELAELLLAAERHGELLVILERWAALESKQSQRRSILGQAAHLATQLGEPERALGLWSLCLNDNAEDDEALTCKIDLFSSLGRYSGLVEALEARATVGDDTARQRADLVLSAEVQGERLGDLNRAIKIWQTIEERFGREIETLDALVSLSARAEKHEQVVSLLRESIEAEPEGERAVMQLGLLGDTLRLHLQNNEEALGAYRDALSLAPRDEVARAGMRSLLLNEKLAYEAGQALAHALRQAEDFAEIVSLVEIRLKAAPSANEKSAILLESAKIEEGNGRGDTALGFVRRAFALVPSASTESELHRFAEWTNDWQTAALAYTEALATLDASEDADEERVCALFVARGKVEEVRLARAEAATESYREAVERRPVDEFVVQALVRAAHRARRYLDAAWALVENSRALGRVDAEQVDHFASMVEEHGDWDGTLEGLADRIAGADGLAPEVAHDLKKQLAVWFRDRLADPDSAEMVLKRAVADYPQEDSLRMLADLQRRAPGRPLVQTLTALADVCSDELAVLREAGEVALEPVRDNELAAPILERALRVAKERFVEAGGSDSDVGFEASDVCAWATDNLVKLALLSDNAKLAVELLETSAGLPFDSGEQVARKFRAAEVAAQGGLEKQAVELCEQVLAAEEKHEGAITLLSELHEKAGRLEELLSLRKRELALDRPQERRLFLRLDQARVLGALKADDEQRIGALRENLADLPGHEASIDALASLLTTLERYDELTALYESQADALAETAPGRASQLWAQAGHVADAELADEARLVVNYKKSAAAHASKVVLDRLAAIANTHEKFEEEVSWLSDLLALLAPVAAAEDGPTERRQVVERLGQALVRTDELQSARKILETELAADAPADGERQLLAQIYRDLSEWQPLATLLADGVEFVDDDTAKVAYLREAATVQRKYLGDLEIASALLSDAVILDPVDRTLKLMLADTLRVAERYQEAAQLLHQLLEEFGRRRTKERAYVHKQLAKIAEASGDLDEALEQAESAEKIERADAGILMLVGQLARRKGMLERAEQSYRTLALIASRGGGAKSEEDGEAVGESSVLFELYRIAEERGETQQANERLDSALEVATREPAEALRLAESLAASGQLDLLLNALQSRLDAGLKGETAATMLVTRANVLEQSERLQEALSARMQALSETPGDSRLLEASQKLAEKCGQGAAFWEHVMRLAEATQAEASVSGELWYRAGYAFETEFADLAQAANFYERASASGHKPKRAFVALDRVLDVNVEPARVFAALSNFVGSKGADSHPSLLADALYRLADMELGAGNLDAAAAHLMHALELESQPERALAMLEPRIRSGASNERLLILFLSVSRKAAPEETLLFAFRKAAAAQTVEAPVLDEAIALARKIDDQDALRELISRTIELHADEPELVSGLIVERATMARADGDPALEVDLLGRVVDLFEGDDGFELRLRRATCLVEELHQVDVGQKAFEELFEATPLEGRVWRPLLSLYRAAQLTDKIEEVIEQIADRVTDESDLEALKLERVRLMMRDGRNDEAEQELRETLESHPQMAEAATLLADILRAAGRADELRELLGKLLDQARGMDNGALMGRYGIELARLVEPEDREEAINILIAGIELTKDNKQLLSYLLGLYTDEDNQSERTDVMEYLLALESGEPAKLLCLQLHDLRSRLGDDYGAGRALEIGVRRLPGDVELVEMLMDHLRKQGEHGPLADALMVRGGQLSGSDAALRFADAAQLYDEFLGDPLKAAEAFEAAYSADPGDVTFIKRALVLRLNLGEVDSALLKLEAAINAADDFNLPDLLQLRAETISREKMGDRDAMALAAHDLERALGQLLPEEQEAELQQLRITVLTELRSLHQSYGDLESERTIVVQLAQVFEGTGDQPAAIDVLASWVRDHEEDAKMCELLGQKALASGDISGAVFGYQKMSEASEGAEKIRAVLLLTAAAEAMGDIGEARMALEDAFAVDPSNEAVFDKLRQVYEASGSFGELAAILRSEVEKSDNEESKFGLLVQIGDLYLKAGEPHSALDAFEEARGLGVNVTLVTAKLAQVYLAEGESEKARELLDEAIKEHGKRRTPELALLQQGLAQVEEAAGNVDGMFAWLEAALMSDRNNVDIARELAVRGQETERYDIAIKALQNLTLSKAEGGMSKAEAYFRQAQIALIQGDPKKSLLMARRAQAADGELAGLADLLAQVGG